MIYDPAVYYGHREIELAFTHMFGGFSSDFYRAYEEVWPLASGFSSRKDIYNLYPLLVHTNLFGGHYGRQVESIVRRF
ncbi:MAG: fructosamine kinase family protein [Balneolaceae bacterium]|nr:fructosamine kinase family protein [Balneolaceae bacterium]